MQAFIEAFPDEADLADGGAEGIIRATPEAIRESDAGRSAVLAGWAQAITVR